MEPKAVSAGRGIGWYVCGWELYRRDWVVWTGLGVLLLLFYVVLPLIPFIGPLVAQLVTPMLMAGLMFAARMADTGERVTVGHLLEGWRDEEARIPLLVLGALQLAAWVLLAVLVAGLFLATLDFGAVEDEAAELAVQAAYGKGLFALLFAAALVVPVIMAFFYAPALVLLEKERPLEAMKRSFKGCLVNVVPFLLFGVAWLVLGFIAAIPLALGYLVLIPVTATAVYCSYREVFT